MPPLDPAPTLVPELLPCEVELVVEIPRGGFAKRTADGRLEFVSPLPCPFNYGSVPAFLAGDGEALDAVLLGPRRPRGHRGTYPLVGRVRFRDAGVEDPKWLCAEAPPDDALLRLVDRFFSAWALAKLAVHRARGRDVEVRYAGIDLVAGGRVLCAWSGGTTRARYRARGER